MLHMDLAAMTCIRCMTRSKLANNQAHYQETACTKENLGSCDVKCYAIYDDMHMSEIQ
jgi:hypothetical protein